MNESTVEVLLLVRFLALPKKNRPGPKRVRDDLYPFFQHRLSAGQWHTACDTALDRLESTGAISRRPFSLSQNGRERACQYLGVQEVPDSISWPTLRDKYLVAKACGLEPSSEQHLRAVADVSRLRGLVVAQGLELPSDAFPTLKQAIDALAWRQLGLETSGPFTEKNVIRHLLGEDLASPSRLNAEQLRNQFPARVLNASRTDVNEIRKAVLQRLCGEAGVGNSSPPQPEEASPTFDLGDFSQQVQRTADVSTEGRYGNDKVFINRLWDRMRGEPVCRSLDFDRFKGRLTEANHQGLLRLSRADLVGAMDPQDVAESETRYLNATFHFVQADQPDECPRDSTLEQ